ncbi:MAG: DNA cytosine methyltransferase [Lactobacillaceae bacterium]
MTLKAIDLFSGCGGLSTGLEEAAIDVTYAVEFDKKIAYNYKINHEKTIMINKDIKDISNIDFKIIGKNIDIVAGCPPCQGFTQMNRNNASQNYKDERNELILEYLRAIKVIKPKYIMMENVPQIIHYNKFQFMISELKKIKYNIDFKIINVKDFGVPQSRKRLVVIGSINHTVNFPNKLNIKKKTVKDAIFKLNPPENTKDIVQKIIPSHSDKIQKIISMIPKDGGSRKDLPYKYWLECHKKNNVGYSDVYGRMKWNSPSPTITGGCLSPSKGRFLHPSQNRNISLREASLLQSFPDNYKFDLSCSRSLLAQMVGNAIPPLFAKYQGIYIKSLESQ